MRSADGRKIILSTINAKWIHPSLALRLLKANLGPLEESSEIIEFALRQKLSEKTGALLSARPFILGLSVSIWNHAATIELLRALESAYVEEPCSGKDGAEPPVPPIVVLGGPEVSFLNEGADIFRYADYVVRGEGETAFRALCEKLFAGNKSNGVNYERLDGSGAFYNKAKRNRSPVFVDAYNAGGVNRITDASSVSGVNAHNLSEIKSAYKLYSAEDLARKLTYVESSRGCPFECEFCLSSVEGKLPGKKGSFPRAAVREFPLEPFLEEMDGLIERGARIFKFLDRSFNLNIERAVRIMEFFLERLERRGREKNPPPPFCVHFEMIPRNFPPALRDTLRRFPPDSLRVEIGIQTLNQAAAALVRRAGNAEEALEAVAFLTGETNAIVHADLIAGLPGEDIESFGKGFDRLWAAVKQKENRTAETEPGAEIQLGILKLLPGAPIAGRGESYGMRYNSAPPYEVIKTAAVSKTEMDKIKNFARFWELVVNRGNYPSFVRRRLSAGNPVWEPFMHISDGLLKKFGRNWGIDRKEMEAALEGY